MGPQLPKPRLVLAALPRAPPSSSPPSPDAANETCARPPFSAARLQRRRDVLCLLHRSTADAVACRLVLRACQRWTVCAWASSRLLAPRELLLPLVLLLLGPVSQRQWAAELGPRPAVHRLGLAPRRCAKRGVLVSLQPIALWKVAVGYVPSWDA